MDQDYFGCFQGEKEVSIALNKMPFAHIIFTGGSITGQYVMAGASSNLTKVTLELGGINHTVIDATADLDWVAKSVVFYKFVNCG